MSKSKSDNQDYIQLRNFQHYLYCPKRWGLMNINCDWQSNAFVAFGDLIHTRVDNEKLVTVTQNKITERAVVVYNDFYKLIGKIDALELTRSQQGVFVPKYNDKFHFAIVEYKKAKPKNANDYAMDDAVQMYGQKLCVDEIFGCGAKMYLYYCDIKKRVMVKADEILKDTFFKVYDDIIYALNNNVIPQKESDQHCGGCSLADVCLPKCYAKDKSIKKMILEENEKIT
ncbi:MAG TPA: CRISPR-associated protein Cas4 [Clostridia bacterium]|nr:CRISPR-associated protein Cas4 [Clostridia bacterium]